MIDPTKSTTPPISEFGPYELITVVLTQYFPVAIGVLAFFLVLLIPLIYTRPKKGKKKDKEGKDGGE